MQEAAAHSRSGTATPFEEQDAVYLCRIAREIDGGECTMHWRQDRDFLFGIADKIRASCVVSGAPAESETTADELAAAKAACLAEMVEYTNRGELRAFADTPSWKRYQAAVNARRQPAGLASPLEESR